MKAMCHHLSKPLTLSSSDNDEGSDGNNINEEDELRTDVPIEDSEEQESSEELPDVDVTVVEQQVGEKETQKSDNKEYQNGRLLLGPAL